MAAGGPMHVSTIAAFCLAAGLLNAQSAVSVLDYGASNNGTNVSQTTSAFSHAFTAAGPYGKIRVPPGDYLVDNSTGPFVVTNFSGELNFEGQARLIFIANTKGGLWFTGGAGAKISGLHVTYQIAPSGRTVGQEQVKFSATTDSFVQNIRLENSPSAGLLFYDCIRPKVHDAVVVNSKADGVHFANCEDSQIVNLTTNNTGDDGLAFLNYAAGTNRLGGNARNIVIRASRARGITVVGQSDVVVSGFLIDGTSSSGILCGYDSSYNTRVPDKVRFDTGTIKNAGTVTPVIGNRYGIEYEQVISCSFSNIEVHSSASRGFSGSAPSGRITLSNGGYLLHSGSPF